MRLNLFLCIIFIPIVVAVAGVIGWVGYHWSRSALREVTQREFALANESIADAIGHVIDEPARRYLEELGVSARRGILPMGNPTALGLILAERLRVERDLAWLSYGDAATGRFIGVWRRDDGAVILNMSSPDVDGGRPLEQVVTPEGVLVPIDKERPPPYDPRNRPWFTQAMAGNRIVWSPPYQFAEGKTGITASRAWRMRGGEAPRGVFTVDFFLRDIDNRLAALSVKVKGFSCIMRLDGKLISNTRAAEEKELADVIRKLIEGDKYFEFSLNNISTKPQQVVVNGTSYLASLYLMRTTTGFQCIVASTSPESVIFAKADEAGKFMLSITLISMLVALVAIFIVERIISEPLRRLCEDFDRIRQLQLSREPAVRTSMVHEINQIRDASSRMKTGLKSIRHYLNIDVVQRIAGKDEVETLGAEPREITIFFSDIEGFTSYSQKVPTSVLIEEIATYFEILTAALRKTGEIDKFIGDGVMATFRNTPYVSSHQMAACEAALLGLSELARAQTEGRCPRFRTRIGLHSGEVLAGNIGTREFFASTIIGDPVNAASRLESLNKVYGTQIIASGQVYSQAGNGFEWRHLDRVEVAGRKGGMELYELIGLQGDVDQSMLYARDLYEKALALYFARSFVEAEALFAKAEAERPGDKASLLMIRRSREMAKTAPSQTWDGVYAFKEK
ncbi:hypothetical protein DB346_03290 [Verrucomicrobia bacterium LW23]|nr:hypothetical protein DB346_03290 [Verrucomicrobia bacterium LW23]